MKLVRLLFYGLAAGWLSACATTPLSRYLAEPYPGATAAQVAGVPFFPQERNQCGPASLAMLLGWAGKTVSPDDLAEKMFTPGKEGTFQMDVLGAVRREGFLGLRVTGFKGLFAELEAGHPVLVFQNLGLSWYPFWHYAVVIGYDLNEKTVTLHTNQRANKVVSLRRFELEWEGTEYWGAVALPPTQLAPSADEVDHLEAAAGLERAGKIAEAETAFHTILGRWPKSLGAFVGLGNIRFAAGDSPGAVKVLKEASHLYPQKAEVWHNLAMAYEGAKNKALARRSAKKALQLVNGADARLYRESLRSLLN